MIKNPLWFLVILLAYVSCQDRPVFPLTPSISLSEFYFRNIASSDGRNLRDSIVIRVNFEDGDGDLGLRGDETQPPYHLYDVVTENGDTVRFGDDPSLPDYNCFDYEIITNTSSVGDSLVVQADTILVDRNLDHYNFFLTFLIKEGDDFVEYNTYEVLCAPPYHGRYFILNTAGDIRPLEGELEYSFISSFRLQFRNETIKVRIQIQDRALNKSNILETEEFNIEDVILPPA